MQLDTDLAFVLASARRRALFTSPGSIWTQNRVTGILLIGAGVGLAATRSR